MNFIFINFPNIVCKYKNGSFEYVQPYDEVFGAYTNGSWNGLTGMLCRNVGLLVCWLFFVVLLLCFCCVFVVRAKNIKLNKSKISL